MSGVVRYKFILSHYGLVRTEDGDGDYVTFADYEALRAERDAADERARMLLDAKNGWADRARAAEAALERVRACQRYDVEREWMGRNVSARDGDFMLADDVIAAVEGT